MDIDMPMISKFRMLSDEAESFVRDYEVPYDMNLADFHAYIRESVNYSPAEMASIFTSDSEWEKLREFTSVDMGFGTPEPDEEIPMPQPMESITLGQLIHEKFGRLIYVFDIFNERQFFIELIEAKFAEDGVDYPRVVTCEGEPPLQYREDADTTDTPQSMFDEAMDEYGDFVGDDNYDDEY